MADTENLLDINESIKEASEALAEAIKLDTKDKKNIKIIEEAQKKLTEAKRASREANSQLSNVLDAVDTISSKPTREELRQRLRQKTYTNRVQRMGKYGQKKMVDKMSAQMEEEKRIQQEAVEEKKQQLEKKRDEIRKKVEEKKNALRDVNISGNSKDCNEGNEGNDCINDKNYNDGNINDE